MNKKVTRNYIYNTFYQILTIIAPLITTPYVSRVLGVTNIGIYQYTQSIASYFVLVAAVGTSLYGQREIAYLQDRPNERTIAFKEIAVFRFFMSTFCTIIYYCSFCLVGSYHKIYLILLLEVFATAFDVSWFFMGMEDFRITVIRNTFIKITGILLVFILVKSENDLWIYVLCVTAPLFFGNISLWFALKRHLIHINVSKAEIVNGIKKRIKPILILFLPQIAMDVYLLLDKTMIGLIGTNIDQVGYYSQGQRIVQIVLRVVTSLGTVMLPAMAAFYGKGDLSSIISSIKKSFRFVYMISFALLFGLCAIADRFVPIFFGAGYEPVINLIIIISPVIVIIATSNVLGRQYLLPTNQNKAFTKSIVLGAGINLLLNIFLIYFWQAIGASIATVIAEFVVATVQYLVVRKQIQIKDCFKQNIHYAFFGLGMFIFVRIIGHFFTCNNIWVLFILVLSGMAFYFSELFIFRDPMASFCMEIIKKRTKKQI